MLDPLLRSVRRTFAGGQLVGPIAPSNRNDRRRRFRQSHRHCRHENCPDKKQLEVRFFALARLAQSCCPSMRLANWPLRSAPRRRHVWFSFVATRRAERAPCVCIAEGGDHLTSSAANGEDPALPTRSPMAQKHAVSTHSEERSGLQMLDAIATRGDAHPRERWASIPIAFRG
jgi:hypothetical protein